MDKSFSDICIQAYSNPIYMSFEELNKLVTSSSNTNTAAKKSSSNHRGSVVNNKTFTKSSKLGPPPSKPPPPPPKTPPPITHKHAASAPSKPKPLLYENMCMEAHMKQNSEEEEEEVVDEESCCSSIQSENEDNIDAPCRDFASPIHVQCVTPKTPLNAGRKDFLLTTSSNLCSTLLNTVLTENYAKSINSSDSSTATMIVRKSPQNSVHAYSYRNRYILSRNIYTLTQAMPRSGGLSIVYE